MIEKMEKLYKYIKNIKSKWKKILYYGNLYNWDI